MELHLGPDISVDASGVEEVLAKGSAASSVASPTATTTYFLLLFELDDVVRSEKTLDS